jgi:hypothetical protein
MLYALLLLLLLHYCCWQAMYDAFQEVFAEELQQADRAAEALTQQVCLAVIMLCSVPELQ